MNYDEWLKERENGIGGSECSAILGLNPYITNAELWEYKTGSKIKPDISDKERVIYGKNAELPLIEIFKLDYPEYDVIHNDFDLKRSKKYPFLFGSMDGELINKTNGKQGILEIKTALILNPIEWKHWDNQIPQNYYCQILHYFIVNPEKEFAIVKAQITSIKENETGFKQVKHETRHYYFERSKCIQDISYLEEKEIKFWNDFVLTKKRPALLIAA